MSYLKLIIGPMFSGKSSQLLTEINKYNNITDNIIVINSILDKERSNNNCVKTHDDKIYPALMLDTLNELNTNLIYKKIYDKSDIVFIDEAQFYSDLYIFLKNALRYENKKFIIAGLSSDIYQNPIGDIIKLIPLADDIEKLSAFCIYCKDGTLANFTKLKNSNSSNENIIKIGSYEYSPCCRKHFFTL